MKILNFPCTNGVHSHIIPPYVLYKRYFSKMPKMGNIFLLPEGQHKHFGGSGFMLRKTHADNDFIAEWLASEKQGETFKALKNCLGYYKTMSRKLDPDIILDDNEPLSTLMTKKNEKPRISIFRTGFFRSIDQQYRNFRHTHSMEKMGDKYTINCDLFLNPDSDNSRGIIRYLKSTPLKDDIDFIANYLNPKTKLIPGIPTIEPLPNDVKQRESYFYTGPLLMEDNPSELLKGELESFRKYNKSKRIIFLTTGLVDASDLFDMASHLLEKGYAVVTTSKIKEELKGHTSCYSNPFLPLNYVCSISDLIIHHCGSGMYHYPILNLKPFITLGTQCYDREDVAITLQNLGVSKHVPSKYDSEEYLELFKSYIELFENASLTNFEVLISLRDEIYDTMLHFDMEKVLNYTLND